MFKPMLLQSLPPIPRGTELDIKTIVALLWGSWRFIFVCGFAALGCSSVYAFFFAKPVYESTALLLPTESQSPDQLGAAAALLGAKRGGGAADAELYQNLLTSRTVINKLLNARIRNMHDSANGRIEAIYEILGVDTSRPVAIDNAVDGIAKTITVDSKQTGAGGILEIRFCAGQPWLAQQIGNTILEIGQDELREVRQKRYMLMSGKFARVVSDAKEEWESSARLLAEYRSDNRSALLPEQQLEIYRLEMEKLAKEQKYLLVRKEFEAQMVEREKAAPPMMILDPANLPSKKSKPKRSLILAIGLVAGIMCSSMFVFVRASYWEAPTDC